MIFIVIWQPRDLVKISMAKKEFMEQNEGNAMMNKRYHKDEAVDQRFANFKPGQLRYGALS